MLLSCIKYQIYMFSFDLGVVQIYNNSNPSLVFILFKITIRYIGSCVESTLAPYI
jgi:hypothetical protein